MSSWDGIDEFVAVAQTRNFTRAGKRLGRSASQISRDIAQLENRLGQALFYRTTRHVSLTEAGERFFQRCRRLQEERDEALAGMLDAGAEMQGQLRMTSAVAYGERFVLPVVSQFMAEHPKLSVDIQLTDEVLDIVDKSIDLAVRFGRLRDSRLVATRLSSRMRQLCATPAYLERHGTPERLEDLVQHVCLRGASDVWIFARDGSPYVHRPQSRFHCNSGYGVLEASLSGLGLCWLPDFYVRPHIERGELVEVLSRHRPADEGVWAVYPDRRHVSMKVKGLVQRLQATLGPGRAPQA